VSVGEAAVEALVSGGPFELKIDLLQPVQQTFCIKIDFDASGSSPAADGRDLAFVMVELSAQHPHITRIPELERELENKCRELAECVEHLHAAEHTVEERTAWARQSAAEADDLRAKLHALRSNLLVRLARKLRLLP